MDELARRYLLLGLGVGRLQEGIVDAYYGPPGIADEAAARAANAGQLALDAQRARELAANEPDAQRALWLDRQTGCFGNAGAPVRRRGNGIPR